MLFRLLKLVILGTLGYKIVSAICKAANQEPKQPVVLINDPKTGRYCYYVDIGDMPPDAAFAYMQKLREDLKKHSSHLDIALVPVSDNGGSLTVAEEVKEIILEPVKTVGKRSRRGQPSATSTIFAEADLSTAKDI